MKQTSQKKPKVFRTLIRQSQIGSKVVRKDNKTQTAGNEQKSQPSFFFGK